MLSREKLIILIAGSLAVVVIVSLLLAGFVSRKAGQPVVSPAPLVTTVTPDEKTELIPGKVQDFYLQFNTSVKLESLKINLTAKSISKDLPIEQVPTAITLNPDQKTVGIKTITEILPLYKYQLLVTDLNNSVLGQLSFSSQGAYSPPAQSNNLELKKYLPYETKNFRLSYLPVDNSYVFNFIYDYNSADTAETQFNKAKIEAIDFIQSKGIDPTTVVINYLKH